MTDRTDPEYRPYLDPQNGGASLIFNERARQVTKLGYTVDHDLLHGAESLVRAADAYTQYTAMRLANPYMAPEMFGHPADMGIWPFEATSWKPEDNPIETLVKAGALIAAAIDVLQAINHAEFPEPDPLKQPMQLDIPFEVVTPGELEAESIDMNEIGEMCMLCQDQGPVNFSCKCGRNDAHLPVANSNHDENGEPYSEEVGDEDGTN